MELSQRQQAIVELLTTRGTCDYRELAEHFKVSHMTVRRDVEKLAATGQVVRTLGGAQRANAPIDFYETRLASRLSQSTAEKRAIAGHAVGVLTAADETIYIDGGSTCIEFARQVAHRVKPVTVVTNSFLVCHELRACRHHTVLAAGGEYDPETFSCHGELTEQVLGTLHFDKAFLSTKGFVPAEGTFESTMGLLRLKRLVAARSRQVVLLADHTKFGQRALCRVLAPQQIHLVITDAGVSAETRRELEAAAVVVAITAPGEPVHAA